MRITYFHQHFSTPAGSAGTRSYEMARRLVEAGHQVTMVCGSYASGTTGLSGPFAKGRREGLVDGIAVVEFALPYGNKQSFAQRMLSFARFAWRSAGVAVRQPADVVFATSTPLTAALPGLAAKWFARRPFVFEVRDLWPEAPVQMGILRNPVLIAAAGLLEKVAYRNADRLIGLSPGMVDGIARLGVSRDRIALIPNGCDVSLFAKEGAAWRPDGVGTDDFLAVFTGTHGPANGLHAVIDAAAVLKRRGVSGVRIALVGDGRDKSALARRVADEDLGGIVVMHDPVPKARIADLMRGADCGLQILADVPTFRYGTSPNKFFDYLAAGLPTIVNYPGWVADLLTENGCGLAAAPGDAEALADALVAMAAADRAAMSRAARELAEREFARDVLAARFVPWLTGASG